MRRRVRRQPRPRASRSPPPPPRCPRPRPRLFSFSFSARRGRPVGASRPPLSRAVSRAQRPAESLSAASRRCAAVAGANPAAPVVSSPLVCSAGSLLRVARVRREFPRELLREYPQISSDARASAEIAGPPGGIAGRVTCAGRPRSLRSVSRAVRASASAARDAASSGRRWV